MLLFNLLARWPENKVNYHIVAESDLFKQLFLYCNIQSVLISPFELINWVSFWWNKKEISIFLTLLVDHLHVHTKMETSFKVHKLKIDFQHFLRPSRHLKNNRPQKNLPILRFVQFFVHTLTETPFWFALLIFI